MATDDDIRSHYTHGSLDRAVVSGLQALGDAPPPIAVEQLAAVDEFHIGGRAATAALADQLGLAAGRRVLDIGCGVGGAARFLASRYGCRVTGVDLTPEYIAVGSDLNHRDPPGDPRCRRAALHVAARRPGAAAPDGRRERLRARVTPGATRSKELRQRKCAAACGNFRLV